MSGETDKITGKVKEAAGDLTGDDDLKAEGKADHAGGEVKDKIDDVKDKAGDLVDGIKDKFTRD